jgi:hypothetical protein
MRKKRKRKKEENWKEMKSQPSPIAQTALTVD